MKGYVFKINSFERITVLVCWNFLKLTIQNLIQNVQKNVISINVTNSC